MQQTVVGAPYTLSFAFIKDGEYVVPDEGSVVYYLYGNDGTQLHTAAVPTDNTTDHIQIPIDASYNTITGGRTFEQRTVRVKYALNGNILFLEDWYYVTQPLNYRITWRDVVTTLGIKEGEILEQEVDLVQAFFKIADLVTPSVLAAALSSGTIKQINANEAIKITAALDLATVIELKAFSKFGNELSYTRFATIDFEMLRDNLEGKLTEAISIITDTVFTSYDLLLVTSPKNPMTG